MSDVIKALLKAQKQFKPLLKKRTARIKSAKATYEYKFADLSDVLDSVRDALAENGLVLSQSTKQVEGGFVLVTTLFHETGDKIESSWPLDRYPDPKMVGIEMTFMRRYQACALLGITSEDDTDSGGFSDAEDGRERLGRRGLDPDILDGLTDNIKNAKDAEGLRSAFSAGYRMAMEADDQDAVKELLKEYHGHKLYVAPVDKKTKAAS